MGKMISIGKAGEAAPAGGAGAASPATAIAIPDPEVRAMAKRRSFTAAYKLSVLAEADRASGAGEIGALLRRESLYSSHLTTWRRERDAGALQALGRRRGRRAKMTPEARRAAVLEAKNARLERELAQARLIVEVQKKLCTLLGIPAAASENTGSES
jgi:transposase-like protein